MSRSHRDARGGHKKTLSEVWSKRCPGAVGMDPTREAKRLTHRYERRQELKILDELAPVREACWFLLDDLEAGL